MSMGEIIVILIVAVLVLGPEKLPGTIMQIAKVLKALKKQVDDAKESIEKEIRISEIKKEADKYKNEFSEYNENIRKKLSFEEFDELKSSVNKGIDELKESVNFSSSAGTKSASNADVAGAGENLAGALNSSVANGNLAESVNLAKNSASVFDENSGTNSNLNSANDLKSTNVANSANTNAEFSTPNGKISREKAQMLGLDILENSNENGVSFGENSSENSHFFAENSVNLNENSAKNSTNSNTTKIAQNSAKTKLNLHTTKTKSVNSQVLSSHKQRPKHDNEPNSEPRMMSSTDDIIPNSNKNSAKNSHILKSTKTATQNKISKTKTAKNSTNSTKNSRKSTENSSTAKTIKTSSNKIAKNSTPKTKNSANLAKNSAKTPAKVEKSNV